MTLDVDALEERRKKNRERMARLRQTPEYKDYRNNRSDELRTREREAQRRWRSKDPNKIKEKRRRNLERERELIQEKRMNGDKDFWVTQNLRSVRARAKSRGLEFSITKEDILVPDVCPVLGIPLVIRSLSSRGMIPDDTPSFDRLDNNLGYVKENVRVISVRANRLKSDATLQELECLVIYMREGLNK